jgi:hypothetical protein
VGSRSKEKRKKKKKRLIGLLTLKSTFLDSCMAAGCLASAYVIMEAIKVCDENPRNPMQIERRFGC